MLGYAFALVEEWNVPAVVVLANCLVINIRVRLREIAIIICSRFNLLRRKDNVVINAPIAHIS